MILKSIDNRIRRAFSDSAMQYEALTGLHKEIGRELIQKISLDLTDGKILDVGMGTGWMTNRLKTRFSEAKVVGLDFSDGMIASAQAKYEGLQIIQADARAIPFQNESFDLIISNMAYQWVDDLPGAFQRNWKVLKDDGEFLSTMFGFETFKELFESLKTSSQKKDEASAAGLVIQRLPKEIEIKAALTQAGFESVEVTSEWVKIRFPDMMGLLQWTKDIGANQLEKNIYVGKELLARANDHYNAHYRDGFGVYATLEVIWMKAVK